MPGYIRCPKCEEPIILGVRSCPSCGASFDRWLGPPHGLAAWDAYRSTSARGRIVIWAVVMLVVFVIVARLQGLV